MKQIAQATATILKNVKRGAQIGVLGAALTAGTMMGVGCANPSGGNTNTYEENTGNNGGNTNTGDENTGNNGGTTTPEPEPEPEPTPSKEYGEPYDKTIGNGNYVIHNFISDNDNIEYETVADDMNHYLGLAETHIKGMANDLQQSTNTTYFDEFINSIKNDDHYYIDADFLRGSNLNRVADSILDPSEPILADIINHIDGVNEKGAFSYAYQILANENYKEGLGVYRNGSSVMNHYEDKKTYIEDVGQYIPQLAELGLAKDMEITPEFMTKITDLIDGNLATVANNMNNGVTQKDLQKFINLALTPHGLYALDQRTIGYTNHSWTMGINGQATAMAQAIRGTYQTTALHADQELSR